MPISRKRKKKGRKVGKGTHLKVDPNKPSSLTLQDLINVVAYQEAHPEEAAGNTPKIVDEEPYRCGNPECPQAGHCGGECVRNFSNREVKENEDGR